MQQASDEVQCTVVTALVRGLLALQAEVEQRELLAELELLLVFPQALLLLVAPLVLVPHKELKALVEQKAAQLVPQVQLSEMEERLAHLAEQVRGLEFLEQVLE